MLVYLLFQQKNYCARAEEGEPPEGCLSRGGRIKIVAHTYHESHLSRSLALVR